MMASMHEAVLKGFKEASNGLKDEMITSISKGRRNGQTYIIHSG